VSQETIRKAFETRLKAWADAQTPAIPVAWPNVAFNPPEGRYIRAFTLPAPTQFLSLDGVCKKWRGLFQANFCMPIGTGAGTVQSLITSLGAAFSLSFTQDGLRIFLLEPFSEAPPLPGDGDRYVVPVSAAYESDTA
jgi:hypothetical protein